MFAVISLQSVFDLVKTAYSNYGLLFAVWGAVAYFAKHQKDKQLEVERRTAVDKARGELDRINKDKDDAQELSDRYRQSVATEMERHNRSLATVARELRILLGETMAYADTQRKWVSVLEDAVLKYDAGLMHYRPQFGPAPSTADVLAIYAEHGSDPESIEGGKDAQI